MLKTLLFNLFVETVIPPPPQKSKEEQNLFEIEMICNIIIVYTVTFDQFIASLFDKSINDPILWTSRGGHLISLFYIYIICIYFHYYYYNIYIYIYIYNRYIHIYLFF